MSSVSPSAEDSDLDSDAEVERLARARQLYRGLRAAARRALRLARRYREEEGPNGDREIACVAQALAWRDASRQLTSKSIAELGPGLARATRAAAEERVARRRAG